jgi:hypothetical protein
VNIKICDKCGKLTQKFEGKLVLIYTDDKYYSHQTRKSWKLCKSCFNKEEQEKSMGEFKLNEFMQGFNKMVEQPNIAGQVRRGMTIQRGTRKWTKR